MFFVRLACQLPHRLRAARPNRALPNPTAYESVPNPLRRQIGLERMKVVSWYTTQYFWWHDAPSLARAIWTCTFSNLRNFTVPQSRFDVLFLTLWPLPPHHPMLVHGVVAQ
ncbi:hypothetical protein AFLA_012818 [Aspergillus flavus NRRL3357]|nr:hypothetical protein AFLA_012818 [Aspergillus flavus NRRL3357]